MLGLFTAVILLLANVGSASQILKTSGFSTCLTGAAITVNNVDIEYNNDDETVTFDVGGTSTESINVTAVLNVTAYGISVYSNTFNPCDTITYVAQLCPVPVGTFSATGEQAIPASYTSQIPSIAFSIPDIDAQATLELKALDTGDDMACITSSVDNGKTVDIPAVSYAVAGMAGAALALTGLSAVGASAAGGSSGVGTASPSFTDVITTMQGFAINGMMSVNMPTVYRNFAKNFAFSTGLIPIESVQTSIDNFRAKTGGNLTVNSVAALKDTTLVYSDGTSTVTRRSLGMVLRDSLSTSVSDNTTTSSTNTTSESSLQKTVLGIQAYVEQLTVPETNTFMTVLLVVAIVIAAIVVGVLLFKVILEIWSLFGSFPKGLTGFREHYWGTLARTIVQLILVLYSVVVLYCMFQFTHGDSWAAQLLAGFTLGLFTAVLAFFIFKIWQTARKLKQAEGDASGLYEKKEHWIKYRIFYDSYKKNYWWSFVPFILYMFAKGTVLAAADGYGLAQTIGQLSIECVMLAFIIWNRPFERKSGNVINIFILVVRVLSVVCILVFVEELGIAQTTQTVTGVVLIAVQSVLTGALGILIAVNAIIMCCKRNPHRKRRKELEKLNRETDNLTPLDARNSLLMDPYRNESKTVFGKVDSVESFMMQPANPHAGATPLRAYRNTGPLESRENLVHGAAPLGGRDLSPPRQVEPTVANLGEGYRDLSPLPHQPTVPNMGAHTGYKGSGY
ncbi:hypothetical protein BJ878DRAFT_265538 [Calycina marina]|uniref:ML-like domain-containing protein n=1 Tax=Calycina marina TaxID=1763456 RepID=A0A9P7ZB49_9HELO|nr:hypothetical protein BJ878DRAFT_265538 [Calycina marina]